MRNFLINWIYTRYRRDVEDLFIADYFGFVPGDIREPAINFLSQNRVVLEKFFSIQAYTMMKRARNDDKNYERYMGVLVHIRSLIAAIQKGKIVREEVIIADKQEDPIKKIEDFVKSFKKAQEPAK